MRDGTLDGVIPELRGWEPPSWRDGPPGPSLGLASAEDTLATLHGAKSLREVYHLIGTVAHDLDLADAEVAGIGMSEPDVHPRLLTRLDGAHGKLAEVTAHLSRREGRS